MSRNTVTTVIVLIIIVLFGIWLFGRDKAVAVSNFEECAAAGYPIMESFPRQCRTPDGELFVENVNIGTTTDDTITGTTSTTTTLANCRATGCSGQVCADEDVVTTCEMRPEYACYQQFGRCERQANGNCGWTQNAQLTTCLNQAPQ